MTRKQFEAVAAIIAQRLDTENRAAAVSAERYGEDDRVTRSFRANIGGVQLLACDLIRHLQREHPRFDAERFANAAGLAHLIDVHPEWRRDA